jgi:hypothetical protein
MGNCHTLKRTLKFSVLLLLFDRLLFYRFGTTGKLIQAPNIQIIAANWVDSKAASIAIASFHTGLSISNHCI